VWVLRFDNGITSAGVAAADDLAGELGLAEGAPAWARLLARFPSIREQFAEAEPVRPFVYSPRLPYRCASWSGPGWTLLPSAAAFVDPLFSTGIPLTLLGIERLGRALETAWGTPALDLRAADGAALSAREAAAAARLVGASYAGFREFPLFAAFSMFYFAAASHSEMARRLGYSGIQVFRCSGVRPEQSHRLAPEHLNTRTPEYLTPPLFLRVDHPAFGAAFERLADRLHVLPGPDPQGFAEAVRAAVEPLNVAGLCDPRKRHWYPVELRDLVANAGKLGMSAAAMERWIEAAGWNSLVCGAINRSECR
jgi:FADH2 O2-dependent halogenase